MYLLQNWCLDLMSGLLGPHLRSATQYQGNKMASLHETLAWCAQSLSLARISVFGGSSAEKSPPDKGHFVVQPTGSFQQPLRRCAQMYSAPLTQHHYCTVALAITQRPHVRAKGWLAWPGCI